VWKIVGKFLRRLLDFRDTKQNLDINYPVVYLENRIGLGIFSKELL